MTRNYGPFSALSPLLMLAAIAGRPAAAQFLPDLTITEIDISPDNPAVGEAITVTVTARNDGTATPNEETWVLVWYNSPTPPSDCETADAWEPLVVAFPPGEERFFTFEEVVYSEPGWYRFCAWINCDGIIEESNTSNN